MKRDIIKIDENKCTGCGDCVPNCHEGALQIIDGKVRLVSELTCDGLGACIGHCPEGAITIEQREAEPYDEVTPAINPSCGGGCPGSQTVVFDPSTLRPVGNTQTVPAASQLRQCVTVSIKGEILNEQWV